MRHWPLSSVVERRLYTAKVGGSVPSEVKLSPIVQWLGPQTLNLVTRVRVSVGLFFLPYLQMSDILTVNVSPRTKAQMVASFNKCSRLLNEIYFGIKDYREQGLAEFFNKAFKAKDDLILELDHFMPLYMDVSIQTPTQKIRKSSTRKRRRTANNRNA